MFQLVLLHALVLNILHVDATLLYSEDSDINARFGSAMDLDGNRAVIGSYGQDLDVNHTDTGFVHIFERTNSAWSVVSNISSPCNDSCIFGFSASVSGNRIAIGAPYRDILPAAYHAGAAYVFELNNSNWDLLAAFTGDYANDMLGISVSLDGDNLLVGKPGLYIAGGARLYVYEDFFQSFVTYYISPNTGSATGFGTAVALDGDYAVIGAPYTSDSNIYQCGLFEVFTKDIEAWSFVTSILVYNYNGRLGSSVAISGSYIAVGEPGYDEGKGAAYIYLRSGTYVSQQAVLTSATGQGADYLGSSISLSGDYVAIGVYGDDYRYYDDGSVLMYKRTGTSWSLTQELFAINGQYYDYYGAAVVIDGENLLISTPYHSLVIPAQGVAYAYTLSSSTWQFACPIGTYIVGESCIACPTGTYNAVSGQASCANCPAGKHNALIGGDAVTDCLSCLAGEYSYEGQALCDQCPVNTYNPNTAQDSCSSCAFGTCTFGETGATACSVCSNYYTVNYVHGCTDTGNVTMNCGTEGMVELELSGDFNFSYTGELGVVVGKNLCPVTEIGVGIVKCTLPAGIGIDLTVTLTDIQGLSVSVDAVSYASPTLTLVRGCSDSEPLPHADGTSACYRNESDVVTVSGNNFGPNQASVLIGGVKATQVSLSTWGFTGWEQNTTIVQVPAGSGLSVSVNVLQASGELSGAYKLLSYRTCGPGFFNSKNDSTGIYDCVECVAGYFNSEQEVFSCLSCPVGFFCGPECKEPSSCDDILEGSSSAQLSRSEGNCNCEIQYYAGDGVCVICAKGMICETTGIVLSEVSIYPGYWRESQSSANTRKCLYEDACMGSANVSSQCEEGYSGPLCAVCETGYTSANPSSPCEKCFEGGHAAAFSAVMVILGFFLIVILTSKFSNLSVCKYFQLLVQMLDSPSIRVRIKVTLAYFQIIGSFQSVLSAALPDNYTNFLTVSQTSSASFGSIFSPLCFNPDFNFYDELLAKTLLPIVVGGFIIIVSLYEICNASDDKARMNARSELLSRIFLSAFIFFPSASTAVFQTFNCDDDFESGSSYLKADYRLECDGSEYNGYRNYALLMMLIYPIGIPFFCFVIMLSVRHIVNQSLDKADIKRGIPAKCLADLNVLKEVEMQIGDNGAALNRMIREVEGRVKIERCSRLPKLRGFVSLFEAYRPQLWYFESLECVRRLALTGLLVFMYPGTEKQILLAMIICMLFIVLYSWMKPYINPSHNSFMMAAQWSILLQLYGILIIISDSFGKNSGERTGGLMIIVGILLPVLPLIKSRDTTSLVKNARDSWAAGQGLSFKSRVVSVARKAVDEEEYDDGDDNNAMNLKKKKSSEEKAIRKATSQEIVNDAEHAAL